MTVIAIPALETQRLRLRAFRAEDWHAFAAMEARPEMRRYRGGSPLTPELAWTSMQTILGQWALRGYGAFALETKAEGRFAGFAGILHPADWPEPELAYSIDTPLWGAGLAVEAATAARDWGFAAFGFERLVSYIMSDNLPSRRVAAKLGATQQGTQPLRGIMAERWVHVRR